jgi:hypothetical protein
MDRGVPTEAVLAGMRASDPPVQYLVGTPKINHLLERLSHCVLKRSGASDRADVGRRLDPRVVEARGHLCQGNANLESRGDLDGAYSIGLAVALERAAIASRNKWAPSCHTRNITEFPIVNSWMSRLPPWVPLSTVSTAT